MTERSVVCPAVVSESKAFGVGIGISVNDPSPENTADDLRRTALSRREHRLDLAALDKAWAENKAIKDPADAALRAEIDRLVDGIHDRCAQRGPRITQL